MRRVSKTNVVLIAVALCLQATAAQPCSCARQDDPVVAAKGATAVFLGELVSYEAGEHLHKMIFKVLAHVKGPDEPTLLVTTLSFGASCGLPLEEVGARLLVYAYGEEDQLETGLCTRTARAESPGEELKLLLSRLDEIRQGNGA